MSPILFAVIIFAVIVILAAVQSIISKLKSPWLGVIIPVVVLLAAVYTHFYIKVELTAGSVLVFAIPFVWTLEEWYRGRKLRNMSMEKEIAKMRAKDI